MAAIMGVRCFQRAALLVLLGCAAARAGDPLELAVGVDDLDVDACRLYHDGKETAPDRGKLLQALGVAAVDPRSAFWSGWSAGRASGGPEEESFHYRIAFRRSVPVGSVLCTNQAIRYLKEGAPFPGDPDAGAHWETVEIPPLQGPVRLAALPPGASTRAILLTDVMRHGTSSAWPVRFFARRLHNAAPAAAACAEREYHAPENFGARSYRALDLVRGLGPWVSNGKNEEGRVSGPFISDVEPCWFALAWDAPRSIAGVFLRDNFLRVEYEQFTGPDAVTPLIGTDAEWRNVRSRAVGAERVDARTDVGRWQAFAEPVETRGLRLRILKTWEENRQQSQIARIDSLLVFTDLGREPVPAPPRAGPPPPPFRIPYALARDGVFTMAVDGADGARVRNIVARAERAAGEHEERWDLADERGRLVAPGAYRWKAITHAPLRIRYEQTPCPNVSVHHPENSPWLNARSGSGGWLADHSPPFGGGAGGDYVFFTGPCPESGIGFAACDLSGRKLWGISSFGAWTGGNRVASDGKTAYVEAYGWHEEDADADRVWAVDVATQKVTEVFRAKSDERRKRGGRGIATRDGKVYLSVRAEGAWLMGAAGIAAVDVEHCLPRYRPPRKPSRPYEIVPDPRDDFLRLFRLKGTPPGYAQGHGLTYLESTKGPGRRQHVMLTFAKPVQVGSCVLPVPQERECRVTLSALRPDAPYPPDPEKRGQWEDFETQASLAWDVAAARPGTSTRALLVTFARGDQDEFGEVLDDLLAESSPAAAGAWQGRIEGIQILRRRYRSLFGSASVRVSSGAPAPDGTWTAERTRPLSPQDPAIYLMEWEAPQTIRGLLIKELDCARAEIDVWTGPAEGRVPLAGGEGWRKMGTHTPRRRVDHSGFASHNADARYMDGVVDFGGDVRTRAVRLRMVAQWTTNTREGSCARDRLGLDPTRCRVFGVAPVQYVGGEVPVDPLVAERIEVIDPATRRVEHEVALRAPGDIDFGPGGGLYAISGKELVEVDLLGGAHRPVVRDLKKPVSLAVDGRGRLYVFDAAPERRVIRVYDADGTFLRKIGTPGGYRVGPWDPMRFQDLSAMAVDREEKLWVVDSTYWPKRVACFRTDGTHLRDYLGPTAYGGGGVLDPGDARRMFYGPLEFELDWKTGTSRLKNLTWDPADGWAAGEVPIRLNGRTYVVTRPEPASNTTRCGIVYIYETDRLKRAAAVGHADAFGPLSSREVAGKLGDQLLTELQFVWADRSGDGEVQFEEVRFGPRCPWQLTRFDHRMEIQAGQVRYRIREFLPGGAPVYEECRVPLPFGAGYCEGEAYRLDSGAYFCRGNGPALPEVAYAPDGSVLWTYANEGPGVGPDRTCGPYAPGQVVCQFGMVGHETAAGGDLGEFFVYNANLGSWNIWTADGLLAGRIFLDLRDPARVPWTMKAHDRGLDLSDVTTGQEHFNGWFCRVRDSGRYYAIAGHHQTNLVEVIGIDGFTRLGGTVTVTAEDVRAAQEWEKERARYAVGGSVKLLECRRVETPVSADGRTDDWKDLPRSRISDRIAFGMAHDERNLYLLYEVDGAGPFRNSGRQWDKLFKTGACVDLMIGADASADPGRRAPVRGDARLLIAMCEGTPAAVLYEAVVPGTPNDEAWHVRSPVASVAFDRVRRLPEAKLRHEVTLRGYVVEAAVPLGALGLEIEPDKRLKMDWGILQTDAEGTAVLARTYWANKATSTLADAPSEARLEPDMWGYVRFTGAKKDVPGPGGLLKDDDLPGLELEEP